MTAPDLWKLKEPFAPDQIEWRVGSTTKDKSKGMALAYLDARAVMHRLDAVCGMENWQCEYSHVAPITVCRIGIRVSGEWIWKSNGAGMSDIEAEKGAMSDAFKRAAVLWGIGQYLYDLDSPWVTLDTYKDAQGNTRVKGIAGHEYARLHKLLGGQSASQMKQGEGGWTDNKWTEFQNDMWGCTSVVQLEALYREIRKTWPSSWLGQAKEALAERKAAIIAADEELRV